MAAHVLCLLLSALLVVTVKTSTIKHEVWTPRKEESARITNGYPAGVGQFPHQALIVLDNTWIYGGSLITTTTVLTSGYCIANSKTWTIRLGGIHQTEDETTAWIVASSWGVFHPDYDPAAFYNYNVGIVFLPEEAPLNNFINVVALPSSLEVDESFVGENALISGWGQIAGGTCCAETLLWSEVTVIPNAVCIELVGTDIPENMLCAGNEYAGSCFGDYGGALVLKTDGGYKQIGVSSYTRNSDCSTTGLPATFTRVTAVLDWITTTANMKAQ